MQLLKTLGLALCSAFLFLTLSSKAQVLEPGQVYSTGNIVQNTPQGGPTPWVNGVYQNNLTCWSWGDPGYCGPNAIVRPGNNINFSFGQTDLYQSQAVASFLPSTSSGLRVNGYNFSFTAKNGNGWDDGRVDYLTAYVHFKDPSNKVLEYDSYNLTSKYNWTNFNFSKDFITPYSASSLGNVTYGFVGRDSNGWAGPYGPEINNVSFNLKYSVDPCASNVLSSPTCPGYLEALAKLSPPPMTTTTVVVVEPISTVTQPITVPSTSTTSTSSGVIDAGGTPITQTSVSNPTQQIQSMASNSQIQSTVSNTQTKIGEVSDSGGGSKTTVSLSSVLSMISSNQEKTAALEKSVTQAADAQAFSAGETAKQNAEKIAGEAQSQSASVAGTQTNATQLTSSQTFLGSVAVGAVSLQGNLQSNTVMNASRLEQSIASSSIQSFSDSTQSQQINQNQSTKQDTTFATPQTTVYVSKTYQSSTNENVETTQINTASVLGRTKPETKQEVAYTGPSVSILPPKYEPPKIENTFAPSVVLVPQYQPPVAKQEFNVAMVTPPVSYSLVAPTRQVQQIQIEMPTLEGIKFGHKGPVDSAMEAKPMLPQMNMNSQQTETVKKNVQNNEAAGNVTLESIAKQPANYAQYFTMIPDVAFYAPKEIYNNQKTVDNARALRQLSSDRLHQEMVNQQYK